MTISRTLVKDEYLNRSEDIRDTVRRLKERSQPARQAMVKKCREIMRQRLINENDLHQLYATSRREITTILTPVLNLAIMEELLSEKFTELKKLLNTCLVKMDQNTPDTYQKIKHTFEREVSRIKMNCDLERIRASVLCTTI